jgi:DNA-binding transcriptional LysR family regulator
VRLAASTAAISQFLPPLLAGYAKAHPEVRVELSEQVSREVLAMLRERRADVGIFVEGADARRPADAAVPRGRTGGWCCRRATRAPGPAASWPLPRLLDEDWIGLNDGAAVLQTQQQAALAAGRPLATAHAGAQLRRRLPHGGLGPRADGAAARPPLCPIVRAMKLVTCRLTDPWARRRLLLATVPDSADAGVLQLLVFLAAPSQNAKARPAQTAIAGAARPRPDCAAMDTSCFHPRRSAGRPEGDRTRAADRRARSLPRRWPTSVPT